MILPPKIKLDGVVGNLQRPIISNPYLRITEKMVGRGKYRKAVRTGVLEATDSYKLVRITVEIADDDTEGVIPLAAIKAARSAKTEEIKAAGDTVVVAIPGGRLELDRSYPASSSVYPDLGEIVTKYEKNETTIMIGLNAHFLQQLAEALGVRKNDRGVRLEISDPLKPLRVTALTTSGTAQDRVGILMPIRLASFP